MFFFEASVIVLFLIVASVQGFKDPLYILKSDVRDACLNHQFIFAWNSFHVVPSIEKIREIAGDGAVEVVEEYQDVYMCVHCNSTFECMSGDGGAGNDRSEQVPARR